MKIESMRWLACLGLGSMLGVVAARMDFDSRSEAVVAPVAESPCDVNPSKGPADAVPSCCSEGIARDRFLAEPEAPKALSPAQRPGK